MKVVVDCDKAEIGAIKSVWPNAILQLCTVYVQHAIERQHFKLTNVHLIKPILHAYSQLSKAKFI